MKRMTAVVMYIITINPYRIEDELKRDAGGSSFGAIAFCLIASN